ncbi:YnfU family zinc-binding protein [Providencia vermicola]|uniref:YnfU family zinc-binding protein n=1 Tax=Providencia vermicola TaxID=333965 RepID=UPI0035267B66
MSIFDRYKMFRQKLVNVTCPKCFCTSQQSRYKLRKNITMLCPHCGYYFRGG